MYHKFQYISQGNSVDEHLQNIQKVLETGCLWVQLRIKNISSKEIEKAAIQVRELCDQYKAIFIMNDNVQIAKNCNADGVHLGLSDMSVIEARKILGNDKIIGGTANTMKDVVQRINEKCNYIGLGPFRFTETKLNLSPVLGIEGYQEIISNLSESQKEVPIYAIGGIALEDIETIVELGIHGVALSGVVTSSRDKKEFIDQLNIKLYATIENSK